MRTRWTAVLLGAVSFMAACGGAETTGVTTAETESQALSEEEGRELDRSSAATDLRLELEAVPDGANIAVSGVVANLGPSQSVEVRVLLEVSAARAPSDVRGALCEVVDGALDCFLLGVLSIEGSTPDRPENEAAEFQLVMALDQKLLASDREVTVRGTVTAYDLDLDNDTDPSNNTSTITLVVPAS